MSKIGNFFIRGLFGNTKLHNILYALLYIVFFDYLWEHFESVYYAYQGVIYVSDINHRVVGYIFALYPILFYRGLINASSWVSIIIYFVGYVPLIMGLCLDLPLDTRINIYPYYISLSIAMSSFFWADRGRISFKMGRKKMLDERFIWVIAILFTLLLLIKYAGNMRLVNFSEIYQLREENRATDISAIGYIYGWCANFFYPFVFCLGLIRKNNKMLLIGGLAFLFLFSIMGQKSDLFAPLILWVLYRVVIWQDKYRANVMGPISIGIILLSIVLLVNVQKESVFIIAGLFLSRTLGVNAYHVPMYLNFFRENPYTYFSHINFINAITHSYPYKQSIGQMVAGNGSNSNAIFWLMDGVASCGVYGVVIISIIVFVFLLFLNGICNNRNKYFIYTMMLIPLVALVNVSFFTTVLSKGVLFLFLTVWFVDVSYEKKINNSEERNR